jgi:hypothetical protein
LAFWALAIRGPKAAPLAAAAPAAAAPRNSRLVFIADLAFSDWIVSVMSHSIVSPTD